MLSIAIGITPSALLDIISFIHSLLCCLAGLPLSCVACGSMSCCYAECQAVWQRIHRSLEGLLGPRAGLVCLQRQDGCCRVCAGRLHIYVCDWWEHTIDYQQPLYMSKPGQVEVREVSPWLYCEQQHRHSVMFSAVKGSHGRDCANHLTSTWMSLTWMVFFWKSLCTGVCVLPFP